MDVYGIEALLGLPEFRVMDQVIGPKRLDLHLERRDTSIVCPRCQTSCSRVQDSRPRRIRDLPILERPVLLWLHLGRFECQECDHRPWEKSDTFSAHVKWTERLYQQVRAEFLGGCPGRELARRGIHTNRDKLSSIAYSEELISCTISATLQSTDQHHGIVGQKCCHYQLDS